MTTDCATCHWSKWNGHTGTCCYEIEFYRLPKWVAIFDWQRTVYPGSHIVPCPVWMEKKTIVAASAERRRWSNETRTPDANKE